MRYGPAGGLRSGTGSAAFQDHRSVVWGVQPITSVQVGVPAPVGVLALVFNGERGPGAEPQFSVSAMGRIQFGEVLPAGSAAEVEYHEEVIRLAAASRDDPGRRRPADRESRLTIGCPPGS